MKKSIVSILLVLALSLSLAGCSSTSNKYLQVKSEGKTMDLSGELKQTAGSLYKQGFVPAYGAGGKFYDENGELVDNAGENNNGGTIFLHTLKRLITSTSEEQITANMYLLSKKHIPDVTLEGGISYASSAEELIKAGYLEWGGGTYFIVWADDKAVNLSEYEDKARELLLDYNGEARTYLLDKAIISDTDDFYKYADGQCPVMDAVGGYVNQFSSLKSMMSESDEKTLKMSEEMLNDAILNNFEAYLVSMELGQKLRDGIIKDYGAIFVSEGEIYITKSVINKAEAKTE